MSIVTQILKQGGYLDNINLTICNVGSRKLSEKDNYASHGWEIFAPNLTIYGFDADPEACEEANSALENQEINWIEIHIPLALSNKIGTSTLYVTKNPMCSSLYEPNEKYLARFEGLEDHVFLDFTTEIETTTLDDFCNSEEIKEIDFLQVDVQGADLQVLQGASNLLKDSILGIQIEVEFSPLYLKQPLFSDIDSYLRNQNFTLFDIDTAYRYRSNSPITSSTRFGQLLWGDAFYLRDLLSKTDQVYSNQPEKILKIACIADILGFPEYALEVLEYLTVTFGENPQYNFAGSIVEIFTYIPQFMEQGLDSLPIIQRLRDYLTDNDLKKIVTKTAISPQQQASPPPASSPIDVFHSSHYQRHNSRRLEHLVSLGLDLSKKTVLEVGAGIGDHTTFFLDRECQVVTTEGRPENVEILRSRYPDLSVMLLDLDNPPSTELGKFDIVYCYGLLYHLKNPREAISFMASCCNQLLLLETCVSFGEEELINPCQELAESPSQAVSGKGCRPTRIWVFNQLKQYFDFVYMPITQPNHEEFPLDWSINPTQENFTRSVFIASRKKIDNSLLIETIPMIQKRHN